MVGSILAALGFAGCAQQPEQVAAAAHGKEYFPSSKYGPTSRRVIADGQPVPHGGGQYLVGKPYTVAGQTYFPSERHIVQVGKASWYGDAFHGRLTANGEIYDRDGFTAAHPTLPLPSYARVTNLRNNTSMIVRVNDRGPYAANRIMDVSRGVADALDIRRSGTALVKVEYVARASLAGSDDTKLLATLRTNGPAQWQGEPTLLAAGAPAPARVASLAPYAPQSVASAEAPAADDDDQVTGSQAASHAAFKPRPTAAQPVPDVHRSSLRRPDATRANPAQDERRSLRADRGTTRSPAAAPMPRPRAELAGLIERGRPLTGGSQGGARQRADASHHADKSFATPLPRRPVRIARDVGASAHGRAPSGGDRRAGLHQGGLRLTAARDD